MVTVVITLQVPEPTFIPLQCLVEHQTKASDFPVLVVLQA
jgi:hypothetical protein